MPNPRHIAALRNNADECQRRMALSPDRAAQAEWADLAMQWHWLANQSGELLGPTGDELELV
jgi:hypothetical protein